MITLLDNIMWHVLTGPHARFAAGAVTAKRYASGFSPILGFADSARPDFDALRPFAAAGEHFYCIDWSGAVPAGWRLDAEATMFQMLWDGALPAADPEPEALALGPEHAGAALALAELTRPGPFGRRTLELGDYVGVFDGDNNLIAMAGERMAAGTLREISGVCTHPEHQGRGLARRLMLELVRREMQREQRPFLHVMRANEGARSLYRRMGFVDHRETVVRVVSRVD